MNLHAGRYTEYFIFSDDYDEDQTLDKTFFEKKFFNFNIQQKYNQEFFIVIKAIQMNWIKTFQKYIDIALKHFYKNDIFRYIYAFGRIDMLKIVYNEEYTPTIRDIIIYHNDSMGTFQKRFKIEHWTTKMNAEWTVDDILQTFDFCYSKYKTQINKFINNFNEPLRFLPQLAFMSKNKDLHNLFDDYCAKIIMNGNDPQEWDDLSKRWNRSNCITS